MDAMDAMDAADSCSVLQIPPWQQRTRFPPEQAHHTALAQPSRMASTPFPKYPYSFLSYPFRAWPTQILAVDVGGSVQARKETPTARVHTVHTVHHCPHKSKNKSSTLCLYQWLRVKIDSTFYLQMHLQSRATINEYIDLQHHRQHKSFTPRLRRQTGYPLIRLPFPPFPSLTHTIL
jgi:hypothetical protein